MAGVGFGLREFFRTVLVTRLLLCLLAIGLIVICQGALAQGADLRPQIEKADALLKNGKHEKARQAFSEIDQAAGGRSIDALIGVARTSSELGEHAVAHDALTRLLAQARPGAARIWAQGELVHAVAVGALDDRAGLESGIAEVREFLAEMPLGGFSRALRLRLCAARSHLAETDELGFTDRILDPVTGRNAQGDAIRYQTADQRPERIAGEVPSFDGRIPGPEQLIAGLLIDRDGCVVDLELLETTSPEWSSVVAESLREWVFEPPVVEGVAQKVYYLLTINHRTQ